MKKLFQKIGSIKWWIKGALILAVGGGVFGVYSYRQNQTTEVSYSTSTATKGVFVNSISASGTISAGNTTNVETKASGTVAKVYVKNGDTVAKGQKLLSITLDAEGVERRSEAWSAYLKAQEAVTAATKNKQDLEIQVWSDKQAILDAQDTRDEAKLHPDQYTEAEKNKVELAVKQAQLAFDVTADKFEHADDAITTAKVSASAAYRDYQDVSGMIVAPSAGIINNLTLTTGSTLSASSTQSTASGASYASAQNIAFIRSSNNEYLAKVSLTEVDVTKVSAGQKVSLTLDAHSGKSFTGKVLAVDVSGESSSGVSSYPATIVMEATELPIYPNMSVTAAIITETESDVILVPSSAVITSNGESTVQLLADGKATSVRVTTGASNGSQTVIKSGIEAGAVVITGSSTSEKNNNTSSAFSNTRQSSGSTSRSSSMGVAIPMGGPGF